MDFPWVSSDIKHHLALYLCGFCYFTDWGLSSGMSDREASQGHQFEISHSKHQPPLVYCYAPRLLPTLVHTSIPKKEHRPLPRWFKSKFRDCSNITKQPKNTEAKSKRKPQRGSQVLGDIFPFPRLFWGTRCDPQAV